MIIFRNALRRPSGGEFSWILQHPEFVICEVQAQRLNKRRIPDVCNLHPKTPAVVYIEMREKKLVYRIDEICCDSFRQDVEQLLLRVQRER